MIALTDFLSVATGVEKIWLDNNSIESLYRSTWQEKTYLRTKSGVTWEVKETPEQIIELSK